MTEERPEPVAPSRRALLTRGAGAVAALVVGTAGTATGRRPTGESGRADDGSPGSIRAIIDNADPGDTVLVPGGRYAGPVTVDTGITLLGTGRTVTTIDAAGAEYGIEIAADGVTVDGFQIVGIETERLREGTAIRAGDVEGLDVFNVVARENEGRSVSIIGSVDFERLAFDADTGSEPVFTSSPTRNSPPTR